ncbi:MAG: glycosyltransferase [Candidatus Zixiibacteriota bacterium]
MPIVALRTALILPTLNAECDLPAWLAALKSQTFLPDKLLLVDSSSSDSTVQIAKDFGFDIHVIDRQSFSHGGTRQECVERLADSELLIFLTQDAILATPESLARLIQWFDDPQVGAAYGRQLPRQYADPIEAHARLFNYPDQTSVRTRADIARLGLKTSFISNSFAAWRRRALLEVGGFPLDTIQNEDTFAASRMILAGWKVVYEAGAAVYHSHPFTIRQEFRRYFDIGVFHARAPWIRREFGGAGGEGIRFICSQMSYLRKVRPWAIPSAILRAAMKLIGYRLGAGEQWLPSWFKRYLSANKSYWKQTQPAEERHT